MRKYSLLLGALGGAFAGYLFSNEKLRADLSKAKTAEDAGKVLSKHLQHDGQKLGGQVKQLVDSDMVQDNMKKAKKYAADYFEKAKKDMTAMLKQGEKKAMKMGKVAGKKAMKVEKKMEKKAMGMFKKSK